MNNNKQTATEWLYKNLKSHFEHDGDLLEVVQMSFEQAKEMEKEQIIDAYDKGEFNQGCNGDAEQYYNETYGK
jgi:hypothetical protein